VERDTDCLVEVGKRIRQTYDTDLAKGAKVSVKNLQDKDINTYWQSDSSPSLMVELSRHARFQMPPWVP